MAFKVADRIRESTLTAGTGTLALGGATLGGYLPFSSFMVNGDTTSYCVADPFTGLWEAGIGTYVFATNAIARTAPGVYAGSSGAGVLVALPATDKPIFCTLPAIPTLLAGVGTPALPGITFNVEQALGITRSSAGILGLCAGGNDQFGVALNLAILKNVGQLGWTSGNLAAAVDTALARAVAGVIRVTDGAGGVGWAQSPAGESSLAADFTTAGTAMLSLGMAPTISLLAGRKYAFDLLLIGQDSTAAQGVQADLNGGTVTATDIRAHALIFDTALQASEQAATLANAYNAATFGTGQVSLLGTIEVNAAGTFIPRAAKNSAGGATLTIRRGSRLRVADIT